LAVASELIANNEQYTHFDAKTSTDTIASLMSGLDVSTVKRYIRFLQTTVLKVFVPPHSEAFFLCWRDDSSGRTRRWRMEMTRTRERTTRRTKKRRSRRRRRPTRSSYSDVDMHAVSGPSTRSTVPHGSRPMADKQKASPVAAATGQRTYREETSGYRKC
jgi:hypothetical protein